jgi:hypothetical protein
MTPCSLVDGVSPVGCPKLRLTSSFIHINLYFVSSHTPHTATVLLNCRREGRGYSRFIFLRYFGNPFFPLSNPRLSLLLVIHFNFCVVGLYVSSTFDTSLLNNIIKCCVCKYKSAHSTSDMLQEVGDANSRRLMAGFELRDTLDRLHCEYFWFSMSVVAQLMKSFGIFLLIRYYWESSYQGSSDERRIWHE